MLKVRVYVYGATRNLLDRAGFRPVDRHEIVKEKSVEELKAQLVSLVGENGGRDADKCFQKQEKAYQAIELSG